MASHYQNKQLTQRLVIKLDSFFSVFVDADVTKRYELISS